MHGSQNQLFSLRRVAVLKRLGMWVAAVSLLVIVAGCATGGDSGASNSDEQQADLLRKTNWAGISGDTVADRDELSATADAAFEQGDYAAALGHYRELAEIGDKFSQYRIAVMHERGLGVDSDPVEALAWAGLAAEFRQDGLVKYVESLESSLNARQIEAARARARELSRSYSHLALLRGVLNQEKKKLRSCTGSRIGSTCRSGMLQIGRLDESAPGTGNTGSGAGVASGAVVAGDSDAAGHYGTVQGNIEILEEQIDLYLERYGDNDYIRSGGAIDE